MSHRRRLTLILVFLLLLLCGRVQAQSPPAAAPGPAQGLGPLQPAAIAARKAALQQQLETLAQSNLSKEAQETVRTGLEQTLKVLLALEDTIQKRAAFQEQLADLPRRLRELAHEHATLTARPQRDFPQVTEQLRDDTEAQLHSIDVELQELNKQTAAGELRIATIAKDLEQHAETRLQLENELLVTRSQTAPAGEQAPEAGVELLELRLQLLQAEVDSLEVEREWLTKRAPLQDALLSVTQARRDSIRQDLSRIVLALETAFQQQQDTLNNAAEVIAQRLQRTADPLEVLTLTVRRETIELLKGTAEYRHRLNVLGDDLITQENRNARVKQDVDRLTSLTEKYASGEGIAQRLLVTFERLRTERLRYNDTQVKALETQAQAFTTQLFSLDDQLYDFRQQAEARLQGVTAPLPSGTRPADLGKARQALDEQKAGLREQQQVLSTLVQETNKLLGLHRDYKRLLDDSYLFVLGRLFWLRDAKTLDWNTIEDMQAGLRHSWRRLQAFLSAAQTSVSGPWGTAIYLWSVLLLLALVVPWVCCKAWRTLYAWQMAALAAAPRTSLATGMRIATALVMRAALWPAYIACVVWLLEYLLAPLREQRTLSLALLNGLHLSAVTLGVSLLGRSLLQPDGWGQRVWDLNPVLCRFLRHLLLTTCLAVLLLLIPRYVLLTAPGSGEVMVGSLALARYLFLAFQLVIVVQLWLLGRRRSPLMASILARSHQHDGLLWRIWPFLHLLILAAALAIVLLDVLGYRYAARFIWLRALGSLSVVLLLRLLLVMLVLRFLRAAVAYILSLGGRLRQRYPDVEAAAARYFRVLSALCQGVLFLLAATVILELWGFSVSWFLTSPFGTRLMARVLIVALTMASAVVVVQISNALADYLLQPRTTLQGHRREPSRKVKTLAPLVQTLIKVGAIFAAVLVILEQLGISTGPILTGVGIFGLAVGFASQSLIKDVINGLFILFEDSLSVGDVVTLRGIGGQVEKVTLRAVTIRDVSGNVHIIPNGTIDMIANMTKDYSRYVLDVGVAYRENVDAVIGLLRDVDEAMRHDPLYRYDMLEPIEILGLDRFEESAVIIRARLKTRPLQQWRVGREFNRRLKIVFDKHGIEMPFPQRTVYLHPVSGSGPSAPLAGLEPARQEEDGT